MQDFLLSIVGFILAIGILVTIHEYGHLLAARLCGVKIIKFSIGFGKTIFKKVAGADNTEYIIAAIPLGGYVKMLDASEADVAKEELHRSFNNKSIMQRVFIVIAGPLANILFAIFAYTAINMIEQEGIKPIVSEVDENSIAASAGFNAFDEIIAINGKPHSYWGDNRLYLINRVVAKDVINFSVTTKEGEQQQRIIDLSRYDDWNPTEPVLESLLGIHSIIKLTKPIIGKIQENGPADLADLQLDDQIVAIDNINVSRWEDMERIISQRANQLTDFTIKRNDSTLTIPVQIGTGQLNDGNKGRIGINPPLQPDEEYLTTTSYSFFDSFIRGTDKSWQITQLTLKMLWKMVTLKMSFENISGPITIAEYAGKTVQISIVAFLSFLAIVSLSLGIINLLPIPVLDGGHLLMYLLEFINGKPLSNSAMLIGQKIGIVIIGALMLVAIYNDLIRIAQ